MNYRKIADAIILWPKSYYAKYPATPEEEKFFRTTNFIAAGVVILLLGLYLKVM